MWPWLKHTAKMFSSDQDAFKRWGTGAVGAYGAFIAAFPIDAIGWAHLPMSEAALRWIGLAIAGGAGLTSPSVISGPPKP